MRALASDARPSAARPKKRQAVRPGERMIREAKRLGDEGTDWRPHAPGARPGAKRSGPCGFGLFAARSPERDHAAPHKITLPVRLA